MCSVHGEYKFSCHPMPRPDEGKIAERRLSGEDVRLYLESFTDNFLREHIRYNTEVTNIRRAKTGEESNDGKRWIVSVRDTLTGEESRLQYHRIVLCTGVRAKLRRVSDPLFTLYPGIGM